MNPGSGFIAFSDATKEMRSDLSRLRTKAVLKTAIQYFIRQLYFNSFLESAEN